MPPKGVEVGWDIMLLAAMELWMPESVERMISTIISEAVSISSGYSIDFPNVGKYAWD